MPPSFAEHFAPCYDSSSNDGIIKGLRKREITISRKELSKESDGIAVFEGFYGFSLPVKRFSLAHYDVDSEVIDKLKKFRHPNIVRMTRVQSEGERKPQFEHLALMIENYESTCSLYDLIQAFSGRSSTFDSSPEYIERLDSIGRRMQNVKLRTDDDRPSTLLLELMRNVVSGLAYLHGKNIIHGNLKPENVLITDNGSIVAQLSDIGISKRLPEISTSSRDHVTDCESSKRQTPERLQLHMEKSRADDMYSLGCVFFYCVKSGKYPLSEPPNIENKKPEVPEAEDLFMRLLDNNPSSRLKAWEVLHHPIFWRPETRLSFLSAVSNKVKREEKVAYTPLLNELQKKASVVFGGDWTTEIEKEVMDNLRDHRDYDGSLIKDLLRAVRNSFHHLGDAPQKALGLLGHDEEGLDAYFTQKFPTLLIESYKVVFDACRRWGTFRRTFRKYFGSEARFKMCWESFRCLA